MKVNQEKLAVIGLGYVGLPLAIHFADCGFSVVGIDTDQRKIDSLTKGISYIPDVTDQQLQKAIAEKLFTATTPEESNDLYKIASYVIVTVPTPQKDGEPDLGAIISASHFLAKVLEPGQTIIYESSTFPGTLEEVILPILEKSGKELGKEFYLGYSPERIDPLNPKYTLRSIPKVVSGQTEKCSDKVIHLYSRAFDEVVPVSSPQVAEMCKLFENIQRLVNISLVNETYSLCREIDVDFFEALQAAATKPFGFTPYWPGPGIGGHCIPVDPLYFQWKLKQHGLTSLLIQAAQEINDKMPAEIVKRINQAVKNDRERELLLIGMSYKKDVNDLRESPSIPIFELLVEEGYTVNYHDPYFPSITINEQNYQSVELTYDTIKEAGAVVILTDHSKVDWHLIKDAASTIVDTRGILNSIGKEGNK